MENVETEPEGTEGAREQESMFSVERDNISQPPRVKGIQGEEQGGGQ